MLFCSSRRSNFPEVDESYYDPEGDILILEALLNSEPSPPSKQGNYLPENRKELKIYEAKTAKSSIDKPPRSNLRTYRLSSNYEFLEDNTKVASHYCLRFGGVDGINLEFCSHKILIEEDYDTSGLTSGRVIPKDPRMSFKEEVEKLLMPD
ncbi:hypothetical protein Tco_0296172 [Tanacetum coccineum]